MKQKIVIQVQMHTEKCKTKALKIVAGTKGVNSLKIEGAQREKIVVTGEDIDITKLSAVLRKKVGFTTILRVQESHGQEERETTNHHPSIYPYPPPFQLQYPSSCSSLIPYPYTNM